MFEYLKKYINKKNTHPSNSFYPIEKSEVEEQEKRLGIQFPDQLKIFWDEIGCGFLKCPEKVPDGYKFGDVNRIGSPSDVVDMVLLGQDSGLILHDTWEQFKPGDLPFFEIGDAESFMVMKLNSDNPNAVWFMGYEKVEDSLEDFIHNLYYKGPSYYADNW